MFAAYYEKIKKKIINATSTVILPGFDGIPLSEVIRFFVKGLMNASLTMRASALSFRFFMAIFPSILFLFTLIPYVPIDNFQQELLLLLSNILPDNVYAITGETIEDLINNKQGELLSFGFLFTLYLTTDGIHAMIDSFNQISHFTEKRSALSIWLVSILMVLIFTLVLLAGIALIVFGNFILQYLLSNGLLTKGSGYYLIIISKWIILVMMFFFALSFLYYLGPGGKSRFRFISAGASLATVLIILVSLAFGYYVNNFATYNKLYGSIGTIIVVMLWIYFNTLGVLIGYELNAGIKAASINSQKEN
jgi:membrane protein